MMNKLILVVDDDVKIVELVQMYLKRDGYTVLTACDGGEALVSFRENNPDLVILDLMLPSVDGLEICRIMRSESDVPIIMLTARTSDRDKLTGLDSGADDYVTKPFSPGELAARVRAVLRRLPSQRGPAELRHGVITVNMLRREARISDRPLDLTTVEFNVLAALVKEPGRVFDRMELIDRAMGHDFEGFDRVIDVHIFNLRRKIEPDPKRPRYIKTIYGAGYKLSEE